MPGRTVLIWQETKPISKIVNVLKVSKSHFDTNTLT